ncbi:MAG: SDR family oxidoreductase [Gemmatimonadaceae bacterium]
MTESPWQVVLVTGAASGIGAACARRFAQDNALVFCADREWDGVQALVAEIGASHARALRLDVTDEDSWNAAMREVQGTGVALTTLVHAAGISAGSPLRETSLVEWRRVMAVNLDGAFLATRHGVEAMHATGGAIVLLGSASGIRPAVGALAYSTSKSAVAMLARGAAKECLANGIPVRVNVVSPGGVKTSMWRTMPFFIDLVEKQGSEDAAFAALAGTGPAFATAEEIAAVVHFVASPAASQLTGAELAADGGYVL